ncbi:MAG: hypothetical protein KY443_05385, partial [Actinobacteria bacterium]|nr:hypothetical protein [Actinomycetota bacterium]
MAVPSSLARRYAPFLILAGVQVLLVAVVPSTGGPNDNDRVAAGPGAFNNDDYIPGEEFNPDGTPVDPNSP